MGLNIWMHRGDHEYKTENAQTHQLEKKTDSQKKSKTSQTEFNHTEEIPAAISFTY